MDLEKFLDQKGLFFVVDWDTRTLGERHDKLRGAAKEFNQRVKENELANKEYHLAVVEINYLPLGQGTPTFVQTLRHIKLPPLEKTNV
jgi:hypothetical protein